VNAAVRGVRKGGMSVIGGELLLTLPMDHVP
jgi:hypothetical protein